MTLDEAIKHCEEVAEENEKDFRLCPYPSQECNGSQDCRCLKNGSGKGCKAGMEEAAETHKKMEMLIEALKTGNITVNNVPISDELIRREDALDILDQFEDSVENGERGFYEIARCMMQNLDAEDLEKPRMKMISREVKDTLVKRLMPMCTWNGMPKEAVNRLMEITRYVINLE